MTNTLICSLWHYSTRYALIYLMLSALCILTIGSSAHAQEEAQATNYGLTESIGLLGTKDKGSFGSGVYRGTKRSELTALLKLIEQSQWVSMRPLVKDYLLTEADSSALTQDVPINLGEDLLTLRLNALLRLGYNREAFELYRKAADNKLDEPTIRTGVYSMLFNRQKGLACLEVKTAFPKYKDISIWKKLNSYCEASLKNQQKEIFEYTPESFSALPMLKRAILSAEGNISTDYITEKTITTIPPQHIAIFLNQPLNDLQRALLLGAAIDYAIEPPKTLSTFYNELFNQHDQERDINGDIPVIQSSAATDDLLTLAQLYKETKNSTDRAEKISQAIELANKYSDKLLIPFLPAISKLDIDKEISLEDGLTIAPLYLYTADTISKSWIKYLIKADFSDENQKRVTQEKLLISLFLLYKNSDDALSNKVYKHLSSTPLRSSLTKDIKNIIENIDSPPTNSDKVRTKDINGFDLDIYKGYTMPPYRVLITLKQASDDQDISVSLLLSSCILSKVDRQSTYIGMLGDIASALTKVGIKTAPRRIIAQALMQAGK